MSNPNFQRYQRQMILPSVGSAGQQRLASSRVLIVGLGGLGSPVATYLAAAGVGCLGLADNDRVETSNLHRQILHDPSMLGHTKVDSACERLHQLNPEVRLIQHPEGITPENAGGIFTAYDVIVDGSDNFPTRFLCNDAAFFTRKPLVYGSIFQFEGQVSRFDPAHGGPCYRCLFPTPPAPGTVPNCSEAGVLGPLCGIVGSWQAMEAIKVILGIGDSLSGKLLRIDTLTGVSRSIAIKSDPHCPLCGLNPSIAQIHPDLYETTCHAMIDPVSPASEAELPLQLDAEECQRRLRAEPAPLLLDVREPEEHDYCRLNGSKLIPLSQIGHEWDQLPRDRDVIVYCHHGGRSLYATRFLRERGLARATNLIGGIDHWSKTIDPTIPRY